MSDCQICFTQLDAKDESLLAQDPLCKEDKDVSDTVFRLSCGHAFHTACLIRSFRAQVRGCPTCRNSGDHAANLASTNQTRARNIVTEVVLNNTNNGQISLSWNVDSLAQMYDEVFPEVVAPIQLEMTQNGLPISAAEVSEAANKLQSMRKSKGFIQRARHRLNVAKKEYLETEKLLLEERRLRMKNAVERFRESYYPKFDSLRRNLKRELKRCAQLEKTTLQELQGDDEKERICQLLSVDETEQSFDSIAKRRPSDRQICNMSHCPNEPSMHSFWFM